MAIKINGNTVIANDQQIYINNTGPTIYFQDSDSRSSMIHCNSNIFYILRGSAVNSTTWAQYNGQWPLMISLENNNATFGGNVEAITDVRAPIFYDSNNTGYYCDPNAYSYFNQLGLTGLLYTRVNDVAFTIANDATFSVRGNASYGAVMSFHRVGTYAVNFGLDTDNVMKLGGWSASTVKHNWDMSGNYFCTGNITAYYSDERLKDFHGTIPNALDRILQLNGYYFTENQTAKDLGYSNDRMQVGLSAQEVERILPEVITDAPIENDQGYKTIWYDKMVPLLVEAIKEQQTIINDQKSQLEEQNTRLSTLETQLETLLNKL